MRPQDKGYIEIALKLAQKAKGWTSPNPCVGAVIVKDGKIAGTGYHKQAGGPHAEIYALKQAGDKAKDATLYVSLEPCCHYGKTPPCVKSIISYGIKRVVVAMKDPNPLNNGKGIAILKGHGIKTEVGVLRKEAELLNEAFIKHITKGMPFVTIKAAQSLDGKIATQNGDSKWISGKKALEYTHRLRSQHDAILVGINTILKDNPLLTSRPKARLAAKQPIRIILDSTLKTPAGARILNSKGAGVIIATSMSAPKDKINILTNKGVEIIKIDLKNGKIDLRSLLRELAKRQIMSILIEGGGEVIASAFEAKVVDKFIFFIAPMIIGGRSAPTSIEGDGIKKIKNTLRLKNVGFEKIGEDFLVKGYTGF